MFDVAKVAEEYIAGLEAKSRHIETQANNGFPMTKEYIEERLQSFNRVVKYEYEREQKAHYSVKQ